MCYWPTRNPERHLHPAAAHLTHMYRDDPVTINRRTLLASASALIATIPVAWPRESAPSSKSSSKQFPRRFVWGTATAGHQVEGNDTNSDCWMLENLKPTLFAEPSRDAANSFELWATDLDLVKSMGLNAYRFSLEWSRIEPEEGLFSIAMLDHYKAIIEGCRQRGLTPVVTFNHYAAPRWFAAAGGWVNPHSPDSFARYCDRAARHLGAAIGYATTLNEPNIMNILRVVLPPPVMAAQRAMLEAAAKATGTAKFAAGNAIDIDDIDASTNHLIAAHQAGRTAIKAAHPMLPVGVSLAMFDDQAAGDHSIRDAMRTPGSRTLFIFIGKRRQPTWSKVTEYEEATTALSPPSIPTCKGVAADKCCCGAEVGEVRWPNARICSVLTRRSSRAAAAASGSWMKAP